MWGPRWETMQDLGSNRDQTNGACWYLSQCLIFEELGTAALSDQSSGSLKFLLARSGVSPNLGLS